MDIMTGIAALSQALNVAKSLKEFEQSFNDAEYKLKIAELYSSLADAKMALADAKSSIDDKENEIASLKKDFQKRGECIRQNELLYDKGADGRPTGHPYCPRCETIEGKMVKMNFTPRGHRGEEFCPHCKTNYSNVVVFPH